ncbi:hypothetical protein [Cupriavidus sp. CP313]
MTIGLPENDGFELKLQLPTLIPQTVGASQPLPVLPITMRYPARPKNEETSLQFQVVEAGLEGATFAFQNWPSSVAKKLGAFHLAPFGDATENPPFVRYFGQRNSPPFPLRGDMLAYWAILRDDGRKAIARLLRLAGLADDEVLLPVLYKSPQDLSWRLPTPQDVSKSSTVTSKMILRLAVQAPSGTKDGRLGWNKNAFVLDLTHELGAHLRTNAPRMLLDCEIGWTIRPDTVWVPTLWVPTVRVSLHWDEWIALERPEPLVIGDTGPSEFTAGGLFQAAHSLRALPSLLPLTHGARPQSLFPLLTCDRQSVRFTLYAPPFFPVLSDSGALALPGVAAAGEPLSSRLTLADPDTILPGEHARPLQCHATFGGLASENSDPKARQEFGLTLGHDDGWQPKHVADIDTGTAYFASFLIDISSTPAWTGRIGSLQFYADAGLLPEVKAGSNTNPNRLTFGGAGARTMPAVSFAKSLPVAVNLTLTLPLSSVRVLAPDRTVDTSTIDCPHPILIPLNRIPTPKQLTQPTYYLQCTERCGPSADHVLEATIYENDPQNSNDSYLLLSTAPFSLARFSSQSLGARGGLASGATASYNSGVGQWRFAAVAPVYRYSLPPQSVGESADKPHRLELHDFLGTPEEDDPVDPQIRETPRPYRQFTKHAPSSALQRRVVEFRLSPNADLWVLPSDVDQRYFLPEMQAYDLFRQRSSFGLGAKLLALRAEFLYGLAVSVNVSKERGASRGARVAEIEALQGQIPRASMHENSLTGMRWNALRPVLIQRPERLEIWADDPQASVPISAAHFRDGVSFALRETALLRSPVSHLEDGSDPSTPQQPEWCAPATQATGSFRYHPNGLSGGVLWPVESANLFRALARDTVSGEGSLDGLAFSPMGGDATQQAVFLDGKVSILTRTRNGHIESQRVEVLGRVGALWHRAKHVVVYERTVNPSAQFAPTYAEDRHRTRSRRPILRKVNEFIEILERERAYPDFPGSKLTCGCLDSVRFNGIVINVDSAWGADVGRHAWEVPLWNRAAASERPKVYPFPDVAFCCIAEGDTDRPVVAQECLDCDLLYFYADFKSPGSNTDLWPLCRNVDYANAPDAKVLAACVDAGSRQDAKGTMERRRPVQRALPGLRRFTWRLGPASRKVAINAGRANKPIYVALESITFMRALPRSDSAERFKPYSELLKASADAAALNTPGIHAVLPWNASNERLDGVRKSFSEHIARVLSMGPSSYQAGSPGPVEALQTWWGKNQATLAKALNEGLNNAKNEAANCLTPLITAGSTANIPEEASGCNALRDQALSTLHGKAMLVQSILQDWERTIEIPKSVILPSAKQDLITAVVQFLIEQLQPIFDEASSDLAKIKEGKARAHAIVSDILHGIDASVAQGNERIRAYAMAYDASKPWSPARRQEFVDGLLGAARSFQKAVDSELEDARQRFTLELSQATLRIGNAVGAMLAATDGERKAAFSRLRTYGVLLAWPLKKTFADASSIDIQAGIVDKAEAAIKTLPEGEQAQATALLEEIQTTLVGWQSGLRTFELRLSAIDKAIELNLEGIAVLLGDLADAIRSILFSLDRLIREASDISTELGNAKLDEVSSTLKEFTKGLEALALQGYTALQDFLAAMQAPLDKLVDEACSYLSITAKKIREDVAKLHGSIDVMASDLERLIDTAQSQFGPQGLINTVISPQLTAALERRLASLPDTVTIPHLDRLHALLSVDPSLSAEISKILREFSASALDAIEVASDICEALEDSPAKLNEYLAKISQHDYFDAELTAWGKKINELSGLQTLDAIRSRVTAIDNGVRRLQNDLHRSAEMAQAYGARVTDAISRLQDGDTMALPGHLLRLYSAVSSPPELAALQADIDRLRACFSELEIIDITPVTAMFNRLGDQLKAIGLAFPIDSLSDRLLPADLSSLDVGEVFRNIGGARLDGLFGGCKLPADISNAIRVTHDLDRKAGRAWVQIDINAPLPGKTEMFSLSVFQANLINARLSGQLRLEVDQNRPDVTQSGLGRIDAGLEMVVSGQPMVQFDRFGLQFSQTGGLQVDFDAKSVRLNPSLQFIQDFLSTLIPGEFGGMTVMKRDGIPIGLSHAFSMPPLSLNFGTSGVTNIAISNEFKLLAYPDFVLSNRFCLSRPEQPFIFSFFVFGGTGYVIVEATYRPFREELSVTVDVAAGASAALAFAFGPFSGQVFITLSISIQFQKTLGQSEGGLTVGALIVIAGYVDVMGIATVGISVVLRLSYHDSGKVDAIGSLSITITISRFFKVHANANANYTLRDGQSKTETSAGIGTLALDFEDPLRRQVKLCQQARR